MLSRISVSRELGTFDYDVIIVGTGAAGFFTALHASPTLKVLLISKSEWMESNSQLAQGGIAAALERTDIASHIEDTLRVGCYENDREAVEAMVNESQEVIQKLERLGMAFDRMSDGQLHATREGGHSFNRIVHHKDTTGAELVRTLNEAVKAVPTVTIVEQAMVMDLIIQQNRCVGVTLLERNEPLRRVTAPQVVLATGGIGELYNNTTNSKVATGDGIAMAFRAGVRIRDMEYVQFHPTAFYDADHDRRFLISEAVRGEGAYLRNEAGERFMIQYQPLMELSARDVVAREIFRQIQNSSKPCVYLDLTHLDPDYITGRFPNIYAKCLEVGVDFTKDLIPVSPVQHYIMGGIFTDQGGRTSLEGLYACGESASTGVHGANRLASNSLLEGLVFGRRIGLALKGVSDFEPLHPEEVVHARTTAVCPGIKERIKSAISQSASIFRTHEGLLKGREALKLCVEELRLLNSMNMTCQEALNMAQVGLLIIEAALRRTTSLGAHQMLEEGDSI